MSNWSADPPGAGANPATEMQAHEGGNAPARCSRGRLRRTVQIVGLLAVLRAAEMIELAVVLLSRANIDRPAHFGLLRALTANQIDPVYRRRFDRGRRRVIDSPDSSAARSSSSAAPTPRPSMA
ncbi:MAG: hypothetical protein QOH52_3576 [Pseudonocardiales bacterium]|nr:hypothetical protein [Pseudonocardiales bacterium]